MRPKDMQSLGSLTVRPAPARVGPGTSVPANGVFDLTDPEFAALSKRIHDETGIVITAAKRSMLVSRLARRLRDLGVDDFRSYLAMLDQPEGEQERHALVSAITTNVTGFFREPHHFEALRTILPDLAARARAGGRVRLWSAGCSTGQEAYSMAATILGQIPDASRYDIRILGTDIDPAVIATAKEGRYPKAAIPAGPHPDLIRVVKTGPGQDHVTLDPLAMALIRFEVLNMLESWPFQGKFDVIFCRNVVIYFDTDTRLRLWRRFAERLPEGGTLFLGHSERMDARLDPLFTPSGLTQYRRTQLHPDSLQGAIHGLPATRKEQPCP